MLRSMCPRVVLLTSVLLFAGCKTAPQPAQRSNTAADIQAIIALREKFASAYNSYNAAAAAACFADDEVLMRPDQEATEGRQAIQARLEADFKENPAAIKHTPLETRVAGNWAYERDNLAVTATLKSGKPTEESVKYLVILKRQPDVSWKVYGDMSNSNLKEPAQSLAEVLNHDMCPAQVLAVTSAISHRVWQEAGLLVRIDIGPSDRTISGSELLRKKTEGKEDI